MNVIVHIGGPKAGSSFLQSFFTMHPEIYYDSNELNDFSFSGKLEDNWYKEINPQLFKCRVISSENISVPSFGFYNVGLKYKEFDLAEYRVKTFSEINKVLPNAKLLLIVRSGKTILPSIYSQYISIGGPLNYKDFFREYKNIIIRLFDYNSIYQVCKAFYKPSQIVVLPYELLKNNADEFFNILEVECKIKTVAFNNDFSVVNKSISKNYVSTVLFFSRCVSKSISLLPQKKQLKATILYALFLNKIKNKFLSNGKSIPQQYSEDIDEIIKKITDNSSEISRLKYLDKFKQFYTH